MKKTNFFAGVALLSFLATMLVGASCSFTSASIDRITMSDNVDETTQEAIGSKTSFASDTGTVYASVKIKHAPADTIVKGSWFFNDELIGDKEVVVESDRWIGFRIAKAAFDPGEYRFRAEIENADKSQEITFTVVESSSPQLPAQDTLVPQDSTSAEAQTPTDQSELPATDSQY